MTGTRRSPSPALLTHLHARSLAVSEVHAHTVHVLYVAQSHASAYKGRGGKGKDLPVLCPCSRVPVDQLEGCCPYLWTVLAVAAALAVWWGPVMSPNASPGCTRAWRARSRISIYLWEQRARGQLFPSGTGPRRHQWPLMLALGRAQPGRAMVWGRRAEHRPSELPRALAGAELPACSPALNIFAYSGN